MTQIWQDGALYLRTGTKSPATKSPLAQESHADAAQLELGARISTKSKENSCAARGGSFSSKDCPALKLPAINRRHRGRAHAHAYRGNSYVHDGIGAHRSTYNCHWGRNTREPARSR